MVLLTITERIAGAGPSDDRLVLPFDRRQKSRLRVTLESGTEAALTVERGAVLRGGDIPLQIGIGWILLEQDHVLEHMLEGLGVQVRHEQAPFEPEAGAYGGGHRHGGDDHDHAHGHGDGHSHDHDHADHRHFHD